MTDLVYCDNCDWRGSSEKLSPPPCLGGVVDCPKCDGPYVSLVSRQELINKKFQPQGSD